MRALDGQAALVTGGGSGIGRAAALALAGDGAAVAMIGRRLPLLEESAGMIKAAGGRALVLGADVADPDAVREAVAQAEAAFGRLDILVNNAGANSAARSVGTTSADDMDRLMQTNVTGPLTLTQAALPGMLARGGGVIVTVASFSVPSPGPPGGTAYSASKAAVASLMKSVNAEYRNRGIRACTVYPGEVDTEMLDVRPLVPGAEARATMMHADDIAQIILLCARMPARTLVEEIYVRPTHLRNMQADIAAAMEF
jgi:NADP-dependent 3-hydroxy acid dehydrogenase YdfG